MGQFQLNPDSVVSFLTFDCLDEASVFFEGLLGFPLLYNLGWAKVWQAGGQALIGGVARGQDTIQSQRPDGVLISFTLPQLEEIQQRLTADGRWQPSPIQQVGDAPLHSFFITGPGGYSFEFQQFTNEDVATLFAPVSGAAVPMPPLETQRLLLRPLTAGDLDTLVPIMADPLVMTAWEKTFTRPEVAQWITRHQARRIRDGYGYYAAIEKATGQLVGQIGLLAEEIEQQTHLGIGYILGRSAWGKGYATEGAAACMAYAFEELQAPLVLCEIRPENTASIAVAKRLGMKKTGWFVKQYEGKEMPHDLYTISREDWVLSAEGKHS